MIEVDPGPRHLHPEAGKVLVLGFLGLSIVPPLAPFAWRAGSRVLAEIDESGLATRNRASALVGRGLGIAGTILWGLVAVVLLALVVIGLIDAALG